jgi:antitoxin PrlF
MQANTDDESEEDPLMMQLFLDFITTEALKSNTLQPYTIEQSAIAHSLIAGVSIDHD